ncbi:benzoate 4-monooxygenase cytochrome P450 [Aureobasidium pullulans]|nr:benzoate 4-monooxygenase cytochrome P450 [Aureobasidium pullulans]
MKQPGLEQTPTECDLTPSDGSTLVRVGSSIWTDGTSSLSLSLQAIAIATGELETKRSYHAVIEMSSRWYRRQKSVFGEPLYMLENSEYNPWVKLIFGSMKIIGKITAIKQIPNMPRIIIALMPKSVRQKGKKHQKFSSDRVDRRLARDPGRPDLWTEVLKRSGDLSDAIAGMSLSEMHANAGVFMTGGTETIATLLSGLTYYLLINPDKLARLVAEIRSTFTAESEITVDELARLPYLNACIEEGLRIYPPTPASLPRRVPQEGAFIAGKWIPGDVSVAISQWATNRHTVNFRDSASFIPERFLGDPKYASDNFAAFQPFSTGPRNCIGKNLAYHEIRLLLTMTLWNFDLSLEAESKEWSNQRLFIFWEKKPLM